MSKYDYITKSLSGGWIMEVRKGSSCKGNIRKHRITGRYQFYRGSKNVLRPMLEDIDIERLKEKIEALNM